MDVKGTAEEEKKYMKRELVFAVSILAIFSVNNCSVRQRQAPQSEVGNQSRKSPQVDKDSAIRIATEELARENKSADKYNLKAIEESNAWRVECDLKDFDTMGGGVIYFIDRQSGNILGRKITQ